MADRQRRQLMIRRTASTEPMAACDLQAAEVILAKLVARAYAADHPELLAAVRTDNKASTKGQRE